MEAATAIRNRLVAQGVNGGERIYRDVAPEDASYPYVIFSLVASLNEYQDSTDMRDDRWDVRAISDDDSEADSVASAIDNALHDGTLNYASFQHLICNKTALLSMTESEGRKRIFTIGATYRLRFAAINKRS